MHHTWRKGWPYQLPYNLSEWVVVMQPMIMSVKLLPMLMQQIEPEPSDDWQELLTHLCSVVEILSTVTSVKGVASPSRPITAPTLLISASTK